MQAFLQNTDSDAPAKFPPQGLNITMTKDSWSPSSWLLAVFFFKTYVQLERRVKTLNSSSHLILSINRLVNLAKRHNRKGQKPTGGGGGIK